jgi:hypothetical protein
MPSRSKGWRSKGPDHVERPEATYALLPSRRSVRPSHSVPVMQTLDFCAFDNLLKAATPIDGNRVYSAGTVPAMAWPDTGVSLGQRPAPAT